MIKKIIISIVNMLLACLLFLLLALFILSNTILKKEYILTTLDETNYYDQIYESIKDSFANYAMQIRIGDTNTDLSDIYDKEQVKQDINTLIDSIYENKELKIDTTSIQEKLETKINSLLQEHQKILTSEEQKSIQTFGNTIQEVYKDEIIYSEKYVQKLPKAYHVVDKLLPVMIKTVAFLTIIFLILLILITKKFKESFCQIGISLLTTGLLAIAMKILLQSKFQHILVLNASFSKWIIYIINNIFSKLWISGMILGIIGLIAIIIGIDRKELFSIAENEL